MSDEELNLQEATAICGMARDRHEYNLGVLSMLGLADLAVSHRLAALAVDREYEELERCNQGGPSNRGPATPNRATVERQLFEALQREERSWRAIQARIDEASQVTTSAFAGLGA